MKSLSVRLRIILVAIGLSIFGYAEVWGVDWRLFFISAKGEDYFDLENVTHLSKNIVQVWTKRRYKDFSYSITLNEINCAHKVIWFSDTTFYATDGSVRESGSPEPKWDFIIRGSSGEALYKRVCK